MKRLMICCAALLVMGVSACSEDETKSDQANAPAPTQAQISAAETMLPQDAELSAIYQRSCMSCHSMVEAKAPLVGHGQAWQALIDAKGIDGLLVSAKKGLNAMPAMGFCADCTDQQLTDLIKFMAGEGA